MRACLGLLLVLGTGCVLDANLGSHTPAAQEIAQHDASQGTMREQDSAIDNEPPPQASADAADEEPSMDSGAPPTNEPPAEPPPEPPMCGDAAVEACLGELEHECDGAADRGVCIDELRALCVHQVETACATDEPPPDEPMVDAGTMHDAGNEPPVDATVETPAACIPEGDDPCVLCELDACCDPRVACLEDDACHCRMQCLTAEQPEVCAAACPAQSELFDAWRACIQESCATQG